MAGLLLHINRKTGVAHVDRSCEAIASLPACTLRLELFDPNRPRHRCSRCWSDDRPRSRASAGGPACVTECSEGNPRRGSRAVARRRHMRRRGRPSETR
jgi:hypothetical protein